MEDEGAGGPRLSKRFGDKVAGEVDFKTTAGTAWSHNFLNQKPWHPLSYPNQRRKWIAEQTHANRIRRGDEVAREYAQEQEFFRQTALISKKEKEKVEMMQAVSFMYVRPPGYNAESAKAAEIADERKKLGEGVGMEGTSSSMPLAAPAVNEEKKKHRPKDVFGRALPTAEEFEVLKNAPRLETGAPARVKPFAVEVRNVKCVRCGKFGHQSGDRECPLKDVIMPNEESRLKRDDPLTAIMAHTQQSEPLKWELKQKPGISPPRGGFDPDDPNQQIVAEDIFDEYGGFLGEGDISALFTNFSSRKLKKEKRKHKHEKVPESKERMKSRKSKRRKDISESDQSDESEPERNNKRSKRKYSHSSRQSNHDEHRQRSSHRRHESSRKDDGKSSSRKKENMKSRKRDHSDESSSESSDVDRRHSTKSKWNHHYSSKSADSDGQDRNRRRHRRRSSHHSERDNSD